MNPTADRHILWLHRDGPPCYPLFLVLVLVLVLVSDVSLNQAHP